MKRPLHAVGLLLGELAATSGMRSAKPRSCRRIGAETGTADSFILLKKLYVDRSG